MASSEETFLDQLQFLVDAHSLEKSLVESTFKVALHLDSNRSTTAYIFYWYEVAESKTTYGAIQKLDFRVPVDSTGSKNPFLYIELQENSLSVGSVVARYGQPQDLMPSTPQENLGTGIAMTYIYRIKGKKISFGVGEKEKIVAVSFDR